MIKGVLIDYGGTIDTNGLHWGGVIWNAYERLDLQVDRDLFNKAYSFGERALAINPIIEPQHTFLDTLLLKVEQQFKFLKENDVVLPSEAAEMIASDCNKVAFETIQSVRSTLEGLTEKYPTVLVSNFYGNINTVLKTFGIRDLFVDVVESAVVGVRKPDPAIYQLGLDILKMPASEIVVIGDSFTKDIVPGSKVGCHTIWIQGEGWDEKSEDGYNVQATVEISDFKKVLEAIQSIA